MVGDSYLRPRLYEEKLSRVEGSPAYPSYPWRATFSYISLQNLANRLHEKQKVGSARRVTRLAGLPFGDCRVPLLAGPTFLHINTWARLAGSTRSRRDVNITLCFKISRRQEKRSPQFSIHRTLLYGLSPYITKSSSWSLNDLFSNQSTRSKER